MGLNTWALELSPCSGPHAARSLCNKLIRNSFHAKNSLKNGKKSFSGKWVKNPPKPSRQGQIDRDGFAMLRIICNAKTRPKVKLKARESHEVKLVGESVHKHKIEPVNTWQKNQKWKN